MTEKYLTLLREMTVVEMVENGAIVLVLMLGLLMFFRSSSPFNRYFIPVVCIIAASLRIVHWAQSGGEPAFMTPIVSVVASWVS